ncbi:MAG: POT family MFS transporter [Verrucomicrobia bacterium]|nr:POT family MFS transporter [Verrucomicrobiota bacterium]
MSIYRTEPDHNLRRMPLGIPYIVGNEAAERFSFYGMRSILIIFMTTYLLNAQRLSDIFSENEAAGWFHMFVAAVYFLPILGAIVSDGLLGKYRTILFLSIVYCFGHFSLALNDTRFGLFVGLCLIALGSGGIKPCVSAHVGDQFGKLNLRLLPKAFGWFYFSINLGSMISVYLCPILLENPRFGPRYAFGLPGILMLLATVVFWLGRNKFVHVPPAGLGFIRELFSKEGLLAIGRLFIVYIFVAIFWSLWDQSSGGEWTLQAKKMDLNIFGMSLLPEQVQIANPILVLLLIPVFNYLIYPAFSRFFPLTALRKMGLGLFFTSASFLIISLIQIRIDTGLRPNVIWQLLAYVLITAGEVLVSITGLEFSYTQAPNTMKSAVMALWLLTVSFGNLFTGFLNFLIPKLGRLGLKLTGATYFEFFAQLMLVTAIVFIIVSRLYRGKTYVQGEDPIPETAGVI